MECASPQVKDVAPASAESLPLPVEMAVRRLLIAEDHPLTARQLQRLLASDGRFAVDIATDGRDALRLLALHDYSIVLTDLKMPCLDGMRLLEEVQSLPLVPTVIVMTGHGSIDEAVRAMRLGAYDFLTKPVEIEHLRLVLERALRERGLRNELAQLRQRVHEQHQFQNIISQDDRMLEIFELLRTLADSTSTVLIEGETGTGKELVARAIHQASTVRNGLMVVVNCAALPENLLESELFGHEKGAFTSAIQQRRGRFELADGGTLFLDEVGDIPATMQAKLLRVLQDRCFERVGGTETIGVDVRVVAATNRPLRQLVQRGQLREDLYYRLNVVRIELPPLRKRPADIPLLARHFVERYARPAEAACQLAAGTLKALERYHWPGNIRELENAIERACVTTAGNVIHPESLPGEIFSLPPPRTMPEVDLSRPLTDLLREVTCKLEEQYIIKALEKCRGSVGQCAKLCGVSRRSISAKLAQFGIDKARYKRP